jgi:plasmid stabilization system protein ParE
MKYHEMFSPVAMEQLADLYQYIAFEASPEIALGYTEAIVNYCESLCIFPLRGTARDDVRPRWRVINYKKRAVIAFAVEKGLV